MHKSSISFDSPAATLKLSRDRILPRGFSEFFTDPLSYFTFLFTSYQYCNYKHVDPEKNEVPLKRNTLLLYFNCW